MGLVLVGNVANLIIFASGGLTPGAPALVPSGADTPPGPIANPLPQALILTAIVIGFGLMTFALALAFRAFQVLQTVDIDQMRLSEQPADEATPESLPDETAPVADPPLRKAG
jgi:multicomponent Na+:H+ antiporter subunit C